VQGCNNGGIGASDQEVFSQRGCGLVLHPFRKLTFGQYAGDDLASTMLSRHYECSTDLVVEAIPLLEIGCRTGDGPVSAKAGLRVGARAIRC
jgi:hypothetical protein